MNELQGKVALVTGGGRGIGRAIALKLAQKGCDVAVVARTSEEIEQVASEIQATGRHSIAVMCDLSDGASIARAYAAVTQALGPITILINNAGVVGPIGQIETIDADKWAEVIEINLIGAFRWLRACVPTMLEQKWGRIINISTGAATGTGMEHSSAYSTSKAGLEIVTLNSATELLRFVPKSGLLFHTRFARKGHARHRFAEWSIGCIGILRDWVVDTVAALCEEEVTTVTLEALKRHALQTDQRVRLEMKARVGEQKVEAGKVRSHQQLEELLRKFPCATIRETHNASTGCSPH